MTESSTSNHEINTVTYDNSSLNFVNHTSEYESSSDFAFLLIVLCITVAGAAGFLWCRLLRHEDGEEDNNGESGHFSRLLETVRRSSTNTHNESIKRKYLSFRRHTMV